MKNSSVYENAGDGAIILNSQAALGNNIVDGCQVYNNNTMGIVFGMNAHGNTVNNAIVFNNTSAGIYNYQSYNNAINNSAIFNHNVGVHIYANGVLLNNCIVANNTQGLVVDGRGGNGQVAINNTNFINNTNAFGYSLEDGLISYYGVNRFINNDSNT